MSAEALTSVPAAAGLAAGLRAVGVRRLFGMPGGGPNLDMIGAAAEQGIEFTLAHGETAACVMAGAFGLVTGTPGTAVVTRGPGLTNAINGLAQATLDRAPLLLVSDRVPEGQRNRVAHQRLDQLAVTAPVTRWSGVLGHSEPGATAAAAATLTLGPPAGAVHLDFDPGVPGDRPPAPAPPPPLDNVRLGAALDVARARSRPVVLLGLGAVAHARALRAVLAGSGVPVLTTYQASGAVPAGSAEWAGPFTNAALERPLLDQADFIVGVGLDAVEPMPAAWSSGTPTVLLSPAAATGDEGYFDNAIVVTGPPAHTLATVLGACTPVWPPDAGRHHHEASMARLRDDGLADGLADGLGPVELVDAVREWAGDVRLTVDAGAHMLAVMPFWPATRPHGVLISNGLATMGYALPAAIGAALATGGTERVVCMTGDGGLGMVAAELETLARLALPVTVVVFDDAALTLIELKQRSGQGGTNAVRFGPVDLAVVARGMGVPAATAEDAGGVRDALRRAGPGPFLLDARIDPASYRHLMAVSRG